MYSNNLTYNFSTNNLKTIIVILRFAIKRKNGIEKIYWKKYGHFSFLTYFSHHTKYLPNIWITPYAQKLLLLKKFLYNWFIQYIYPLSLVCRNIPVITSIITNDRRTAAMRPITLSLGIYLSLSGTKTCR